MYLPIYISIYLCTYPNIGLSYTYPPVWVSLPTYLLTHACTHPPTHLPAYLPTYPVFDFQLICITRASWAHACMISRMLTAMNSHSG